VQPAVCPVARVLQLWSRPEKFVSLYGEAYMLIDDFHLSLFDFALSLSAAIDEVNPMIIDHQKRVAYIAWSIGKELGLNSEQARKLFFASLLHDIGSISLKERLDILHFDEDVSYNSHAELGYLLLKDFQALSDEARIIRYHHTQWDNGNGHLVNGEAVPAESLILHLADRIAVLIDYDHEVLGQVKSITEKESLKTTAQHIRNEESGRELAAALHVVECHHSRSDACLCEPTGILRHTACNKPAQQR